MGKYHFGSSGRFKTARNLGVFKLVLSNALREVINDAIKVKL